MGRVGSRFQQWLPLAPCVFAVIASSSCAAPVTDVSSSPTSSPTVPPIAGAVTFTADQVILPAEQFPLSGYSVASDRIVGTNGWTRTWTGTGAFWWVRVDVTILKPSVTSSDAIAKTVCDWKFTPPALSAAEITAPVVGDGAKACGYYDAVNSPANSLVYTTGTRNALVTVGVNRRLSASESAAASFIASLADYQLWIIDKLAPLSGVALRATPKVQVPGVAAIVTPQPAARTESPQTVPPQTAPPATPAVPSAAPVALSLVLNSFQCGTKFPNQYAPKGYLVQGFVANLTATGPVGAFILDVNSGNLTVLDWTGTNPRERLKADPPATRMISRYSLNWNGEMDWIPITLEPPGTMGSYLQQSFHLSC